MVAESGAGASEWASGSQVCMGASPALVPYPTSRKTNASRMTSGCRDGGDSQQHRPVEGIFRPAREGDKIKIGQYGSGKSQGNANRTDQNVFPGGFDRGFASLQRNDEGRKNGGGLDSDPHQADIVGRNCQQHGSDEQVDEDLEAA